MKFIKITELFFKNKDSFPQLNHLLSMKCEEQYGKWFTFMVWYFIILKQ